MAEIQVDQGVKLGEAGKLIELVARQVQGLDVAQMGVSRFQDPQVVIRQIDVDQIIQVLQSYKRYFITGGNSTCGHFTRGWLVIAPPFIQVQL